MMRRWHGVHSFFLAVLFLSSCGDDDIVDPPSRYLPQTSPESVLDNLQTAYVQRDIAEYMKLLADDFRFYLDEGTRQRNSGLPVFWGRDQDSLATYLVFMSPDVTDIRIDLSFGPARPADEFGHPDRVYIDVLDTFLEVDLRPAPGNSEGLTLRIDAQHQRFFLRKGRTPDDTDSKTWYIVEWRDYGQRGAPGHGGAGLAVENSTWSYIKALFRK